MLDDWLTADKNPNRFPVSVVVNANRWDRRELRNVRSTMPKFVSAGEELTAFTDTADPLMDDLWMVLYKVAPELIEAACLRPSHAINLTILSELLGLPEYATLHAFTTGDGVTCGLAAVKLKKVVEELLDREKQRQAQLEEMQKLLDDLYAAREQLEDAQAELEDYQDAQRADSEGEAEDGGEGDDGGGGKPDRKEQALAAAVEDAQAAADKLAGEAAKMTKALDHGLEADGAGMQNKLRAAIGAAAQEAADFQAAALACGYEPGQLQRLDAKERLKLARKLNGDRMAEIAKMFGRFKAEFDAEQKNKTPLIPSQITEVTFGNAIDLLLPSELIKLDDPDMEVLFLKDYAEEALLQYGVEGDERANQGGIVLAEDGSGSMSGLPERSSKAVMLTLLHHAKANDRAFHLIHFGSRTEIYPIDFPDADSYTPDKIIKAAELFCGGGTDFEAPLRKAVSVLADEYEKKGRTEGDIVFVTDGLAGVSEPFKKWFFAEQERLGFRVYGINMLHGAGERLAKTSEPLATLCDGKVATWAQLNSSGDLAEIWRAL